MTPDERAQTLEQINAAMLAMMTAAERFPRIDVVVVAFVQVGDDQGLASLATSVPAAVAVPTLRAVAERIASRAPDIVAEVGSFSRGREN